VSGRLERFRAQALWTALKKNGFIAADAPVRGAEQGR